VSDIAEAFIQREQAPPRTSRRVGDKRIGIARESFVHNGIDQVAETAQAVSQFSG